MNDNDQATRSAPDFALPDALTGKTVRLSDLSRQDVLLLFLRGTWCPYCREQLDLVAANAERLRAANIAVVAVVCQNPASVKKYFVEHPFPFVVLVDEQRDVARLYGTHYLFSWDGFNLSRPGIFVVDRQGDITFSHIGRNMKDLPVTAVLERFLRLL